MDKALGVSYVDVLFSRISILKLSIRANNVLEKNKIRQVVDLVSMTREQFYDLRGCGNCTQREVENRLETMGLDFLPFEVNGMDMSKVGMYVQTMKVLIRQNKK